MYKVRKNGLVKIIGSNHCINIISMLKYVQQILRLYRISKVHHFRLSMLMSIDIKIYLYSTLILKDK